jgi:TolB protein
MGRAWSRTGRAHLSQWQEARLHRLPARHADAQPRNVHIETKLVAIEHGKVAATQKTIVEGTGGQGMMNVNSWAPDSMRFAYVPYEPTP